MRDAKVNMTHLLSFRHILISEGIEAGKVISTLCDSRIGGGMQFQSIQGAQRLRHALSSGFCFPNGMISWA